jgi:hypothetical protein
MLAIDSTASAQSWRLIELQPLPGDTSCSAIEMTADRRAIGTSGGFDGPRYVIWDANGVPSLLPVPPYTRSLRINNRGQIAGTRALGPPPPLYPKFGVWVSVPFALIEGAVVDLPAPANASLTAATLTDTGILLLNQDYGLITTGPSWAVYQGAVYQLTVAGLAMKGIADDGFFGFTTLFSSESFVQRPFAPPFSPWDAGIALQHIGPGGHAVGATWQNGVSSVRYRQPAGDVAAFAVPGSLFTGRLNHAGDVVGRVDAEASRTVFLFRNGQLIDLTTAIGGRTLTDARQVTDRGDVLVSVDGTSCGAYLVPAAPGAPDALTFALSGRTVTLQWSVSQGAEDYIVEAGSAPGLADLYRGAVATTSLAVAAPPGRYFVRVRARNAAGEGVASREIVIDVR